MDYISFALLCEELERADTAFRVVQSVHVGLNSLTLLQWGDRGAEAALAGAPGEGREAGDVRPHRAGRRARTRAASQTTARRDGDSYVLNGHKIWISPRRPRRPLPRLRHRGPREAAQGHHRLRGGAGHARADDGHAPRQAGHPGRQHGAHRLRGRARPGREPDRRGGRGLPDRDERHRPGPLHRRGGRRRPRPGVPRRVASSTPTSARPSARRSASTSWSSR